MKWEVSPRIERLTKSACILGGWMEKFWKTKSRWKYIMWYNKKYGQVLSMMVWITEGSNLQRSLHYLCYLFPKPSLRTGVVDKRQKTEQKHASEFSEAGVPLEDEGRIIERNLTEAFCPSSNLGGYRCWTVKWGQNCWITPFRKAMWSPWITHWAWLLPAVRQMIWRRCYWNPLCLLSLKHCSSG